MDNFYWILLGMTCITFTCRYLFFAKSLPYQLGPKMKQLLSYTAPSVLTAMWVPIVFFGHHESSSNASVNSSLYAFWQSPFLLAGLVTVVLSYKIKNTTLVVLLGMSTFSVLNYLLPL